MGGGSCHSETFWEAKLRLETAYWPRGPSLSAVVAVLRPGTASVRASERPKGSGTGHSQMELLCRVLALGVSAPSARKLRKFRKFWEIFM